jgi:hypothetical protein
MIYLLLVVNVWLLFLLLRDIRFKLGKAIPFLELICFSYFLQNSLVPVFLFTTSKLNLLNGVESFSVDIRISEISTMLFSSTCILFFYFGLFWNNARGDNYGTIKSVINIKLERIVVLVLFVLAVMSRYVFANNYLYDLLFTGLCVYFFSLNSTVITYKIAIVLLFWYVSSQTGMFGRTLIFTIYAFCYILEYYNISLNRIVFYTGAAVGSFSIFYIQVYKTQTRIDISNKNSNFSNNVEFADNRILASDLNDKFNALERLNTNFFTTEVLKKMRKDNIPFTYGVGILSNIVEGILPRFLLPNKVMAGGKVNIETYTDIVLLGNTSMNIGLIADAYTDFSYFAILFFYYFGLLVKFLFKMLYLSSKNNDLYKISTILLFCMLFSSETDLGIVFNSIIKSLFLFFIIIELNSVLHYAKSHV